MKNFFRERKHIFYALAVVIVCLGIVAGINVSLNSQITDGTTTSAVPPTKRVEKTPMAMATNSPTPSSIQDELTLTVAVTATTSPIYNFVVRDGADTTEIWQFSAKDRTWLEHFEMTSTIDESVIDAMPPKEIERLHTSLQTLSPPITTSIRELTFEPFIWYQALSPGENELISVQQDKCCCDPFDQCFGIWRVINIDLETGRQEILLKRPIEYDSSLDDFLWSPNGRYLAFINYTRNENNTLIVVDRNTEQVQELANERYLAGPLAWSPDEITVASHLSRGQASAGDVIQLCSVESGECHDIDLDRLSVFGGLDWSPDGKEIVFSAISGIAHEPHLHLLDLEAETIQQIPDSQRKALEHPRWSPDGHFIATDYRQERPAWPYWVAIIETSSGQIVNEVQFPSESSFGKWIWGQDSRTILGLTGQPEFGQEWKLIEFGIYDDTGRSTKLPDELQGKWVGFNELGIESIRE